MGKAERQKKRLATGWQAIERNEPGPAEEFARAALRENPRDSESLSLLGASLFLQQRFQEAIAPLSDVFRAAHTEGIGCRLGYCHLALGDPVSAAVVLEREVKAFPELVDAYDLLAISLMQQSRHEEALTVLASALERDPRSAGTHLNFGNALTHLRRHEEAIASFEKALELEPGLSQAHNNLGHAFKELGRLDDAIASYERTLRIAPDDFEVRNNLGTVLGASGRSGDAIACYRAALAANPHYAPALNNLGLALQEQGRLDEAAAYLQGAISLRPDYAEAHAGLGMIYRAQKRLDDAIASLQKALSIRPDFIEALVHLGAACQEHGRLDEAVAHFQRAILLRPDSADAHHNLGISLQGLSRHDEAIACFQKALAIDPGHKYTLGALVWSELGTCRWERLESRIEDLRSAVRKRQSLTEPFTFVAVSQDLGEQRLCAERFFEDRIRSSQPQPWKEARYEHSKIRIAYLSGDFREHPVAYCMRELFGLHDRSRFETIGVSFGADDGSEMRSRLMKSFDRFFDVRVKDDLEVARLVREQEADIAIDLMGYTKGARSAVLAYRPAPLQVSYLGYPGTTGAEFIDYVLADRFVLPQEHQMHYSEKVVYLPDSYYVYDTKKKTAGRTPSRVEVGLPRDGFVFCCFNNNFKITPQVFDVWMRLLGQVQKSVLWLLEDNARVMQNLQKEAQIRGISPVRLIFAPRIKIDEHLARHHLADLFLDTLPYNAHTTASDALWTGLPLLTCVGRTFAGRVAGSLLQAMGLPELITHGLEEYEALALKLARDEQFFKGLRARLERNRLSAPLFNTDRFRRHIESAYVTMWEIRQRGDKPRAFAVEPLE